MKTTVLGVLVLGLVLLGPVVESRGGPIGTAFTYQGQLKEGGSLANGPYDFAFLLHDDPEFGTVVAGPVFVEDEPAGTGLFTVKIDFGDVFDGAALWLEIRVRPGDSGDTYTPLSPRQELTGTPYALYALRTEPGDHGELGGLEDDDHPQYVLHNETDSVTTAMIEDGAVGTSDLADEAVTQQKIDASGAQPGYVLKTDGTTMSWQVDLIGSSRWYQDTNGIYTEDHVGINAHSRADADLYIEGDLLVTHDAVLTGDVTLGCESCNPLRVQDNIEIGGTVTIDWLSGGSGTTVVWDSNNGRLYRLSSSLRYKDNVADLPATKEAVLRLRPVTFTWNSTGEADIGLIAEEVAEVIPDLVLYDAEGRPDGVKYDRLGVYLLQVVKSQRGQIAALRERNERFESRLVALETLLAELGSPKDGGAR